MRLRHALLFGFGIALPLAAACGSGGGESGGGGAGTTSSSSGGTGGTVPSLPLVVHTGQGDVEGAAGDGVRIFSGIPYAAAPVGALRWKPPQLALPWTGKKEVKIKPPYCPQLSSFGSQPMTGASEDCLTVNVWTPAHESAKPRPVMVWIHGGGFTSGSGAEPTYDGAALVRATDAIVVTVNYRLGPLGFLAHSALTAESSAHPSSGMYGFEDQRAALAWVQENAAAFGGDPKQVTVFGESAGGISTCMHVLSPKSAGLFQRAIVESGPCALTTGTLQQGEAQGAQLAAAVGCTDQAQILECLRGKTSDELLLALPLKPGEIGPGGAAWRPVVDGWNMPDQAPAMLAGGQFAKIPVILGTNKDEGTLFFSIGLTLASDADYVPLLDAIFANNGAAIAGKYPAGAYASLKAAASAAVGDGLFVCPTRRTARAFASGGGIVYTYRFHYAPKSPLLGDIGSFHSAELPFVFGNNYLGIILDEDEQQLSKAMMGYWGTFASTGDPNDPKLAAWPKFLPVAPSSMLFDVKFSADADGGKGPLALSVGSDGSDAKCDFWDGLSGI
jgi:para-nitrobenzyl esterase